ncbi:phage terminase small subunit [Paenibacillus anaericanus]|nr:phage terminase small subunit [Paenibacillus anaericanus]
MNERQKRFADEYIMSGNIEQSAVRAGYSKAYSRGNAHKLVANVSIKEYIEDRNKEIECEKIADMKEIKRFWTKTFRSDEVEMKDRLKASEFIAKTNGAFIDKVQHSGKVEHDVEITIGVEVYET